MKRQANQHLPSRTFTNTSRLHLEVLGSLGARCFTPTRVGMKGTEETEETELEQARRMLEQVLGSPPDKPSGQGRKPRRGRKVGPLFNGTIHIQQLVLKVG